MPWEESALRLTDIHVSPLSRENTGGQARSGERALFPCRITQLATRHPHPEGSQGGVCEAAMKVFSTVFERRSVEVTTNGTDAQGKKYTSTAVYDKQ
jgi:hypothetical protein